MEANELETRLRAPLRSEPGFLSSFDYSSLPLSEISILSTKYERVYPTFNVIGSETSNPIEFIIPPSNLYTNLSFDIYMSGKLCTKKGEKHVAADGYAVANSFFHTFFEAADVEVNNVLVGRSSQFYNFASAFMRKLCTDGELKKTFYQKEMFYENSLSDDFTSSNKGYQARKTLCALSKTIHMSGNIIHGLLESGKFAPPQTQIRLRLKRSDPTVYIDSPTIAIPKVFDSEFRIEEIYMIVKRALVHHDVANRHQAMLNAGQKLLIPYTNNEVVTYTVGSGLNTHISENLSTGPLPSSLIFGIQKTSKFFGKYDSTSMTFQPENLQDIRVLIDGEPIFPYSLEVDATNNKCMLPYCMSFGALNEDARSHGLTISEYINTSFLFLVSLVPSAKLTGYHPDREGSLRIQLVFRTATTENLTCVVMIQSNKIMSFDRFNSVFIE